MQHCRDLPVYSKSAWQGSWPFDQIEASLSHALLCVVAYQPRFIKGGINSGGLVLDLATKHSDDLVRQAESTVDYQWTRSYQY